MPGSAIIQLVTKGKSYEYLCGNAKISYFHSVYRKKIRAREQGQT